MTPFANRMDGSKQAKIAFLPKPLAAMRPKVEAIARGLRSLPISMRHRN